MKTSTRYPVSLERAARGRGLMPPLQSHTTRTTFFVGGRTIGAATGATVVAEAGVAHTFRIESDGARWRVATDVASIARFDDFGRALAHPCAMTEQDTATVSAIAAANGIRVLGSPGLLPAATS